MYQSRDEANQQHQESQENRHQIEEDADRELLNMRIRHEQTVHEQQVKFHHVASMYISPVVKCNSNQRNAVVPCTSKLWLKAFPTSYGYNTTERHTTTDMGPTPECVQGGSE